MLHPDYQYTPLLITAMASMVAYDVYDVVLGSRIIGGRALRGGMPVYKYISNRLLTAFENLFLGVKLSEYHTGYRAFSRKVLTELPLLENSDDFVFDNQMLAQCVHFGFRIGEVSCPTKYFEEASSINFRRSVRVRPRRAGHDSAVCPAEIRTGSLAALQRARAANLKRAAKAITLPVRGRRARPRVSAVRLFLAMPEARKTPPQPQLGKDDFSPQSGRCWPCSLVRVPGHGLPSRP